MRLETIRDISSDTWLTMSCYRWRTSNVCGATITVAAYGVPIFKSAPERLATMTLNLEMLI